jgi:tRNA U34 2-thiouridine synthase MnmA/TrmU
LTSFREEALSYGYDAVATGHYAQIKMTNDGWIMKNDGLQLLRGVDPEKDQSYFLSALSREQLSQAMFPIGHLPKSEVREIARKAGLPNAERKDSQGLCFVGKVNFGDFLKAHIPSQKGEIRDTSGRVIGEHDGAFQYTIGQRKGIAVGGGPALFVLEKDVVNNIIIVWTEDDERLFRKSCTLTQMNWLADVIPPLQCEAQIRYRQAPQKCLVTMNNEEILFNSMYHRELSRQVRCVLSMMGTEFWEAELSRCSSLIFCAGHRFFLSKQYDRWYALEYSEEEYFRCISTTKISRDCFIHSTNPVYPTKFSLSRDITHAFSVWESFGCFSGASESHW